MQVVPPPPRSFLYLKQSAQSLIPGAYFNAAYWTPAHFAKTVAVMLSPSYPEFLRGLGEITRGTVALHIGALNTGKLGSELSTLSVPFVNTKGATKELYRTIADFPLKLKQELVTSYVVPAFVKAVRNNSLDDAKNYRSVISRHFINRAKFSTRDL